MPRTSSVLFAGTVLVSQLVFCAESSVPAFQPLRAGEVIPGGWIREQMLADLHEGIAGNYDKISGNVGRNLFVNKARSPGVKEKSERKNQEASWWAGEHEGYWTDGLVRMAYLTGDKFYMDKARQKIEAVVAAQDPDGYIGIYNKETRLKPCESSGLDGELWTQSRILQAMLAYYEFTGDKKVLAAVEKAVQLTLSAYKGQGISYFIRANKPLAGGLGHGIAFSDTLEQLYRLTGNPVYRDSEIWLYNDFSCGLPDSDTSLEMLSEANKDKPWEMHTPHLMEGLAISQIVASLTGEEKYKTAAANARRKLAWHTTPGGLIVGSENVDGRKGTGTTPGEYCSSTEGVIAMNQILAYSGDLSAGNWTELVCLNGAQGARFQTANKATAYLSYDDRLTTDEEHNNGGRILFSAFHTAAACCTLNATRLMPYYVDGMWYRPVGRTALAANLYGPCRVETEIAGTKVVINENTVYPFEDTVNFTVNPAKDIEFTLIFRVPDSARDATVEAGADAKVTKAPGRIEVKKRWKSGDKIALRFDFDVRLRETNDKQFYYQRGPLVFGLRFPDERIETLKLGLNGKDSGFREYLVKPTDATGWDYGADKSATFQLVSLKNGDFLKPWEKPPVGLKGTLLSGSKPVEVTLVPEGATLLRRVTFPAKKGPRELAAQAHALKSELNLARSANVKASSTAQDSTPQAVVDGIAQGLPENPSAEWVSEHQTTGAKVKLTWAKPVTIEDVWLFDCPNLTDQVQSAWINFSDGTSAMIGELPNDGMTPFQLNFPEKIITWMEVIITRVGQKTMNAGFSEIAVFQQVPAE
jgi:hypothetical protein